MTDAAIVEMIGLLRVRWGEPRPAAPLPPDVERALTRELPARVGAGQGESVTDDA